MTMPDRAHENCERNGGKCLCAGVASTPLITILSRADYFVPAISPYVFAKRQHQVDRRDRPVWNDHRVLHVTRSEPIVAHLSACAAKRPPEPVMHGSMVNLPV
jgi:hypothetical protein